MGFCVFYGAETGGSRDNDGCGEQAAGRCAEAGQGFAAETAGHGDGDREKEQDSERRGGEMV